MVDGTSSVEKADVTLCVVDVADLSQNSCELPSGLAEIVRRVKPYVLLNKLDSDRANTSIEEAINFTKAKYGVSHVWAVSLRTGTGVDAFIKEIGEKLQKV